MQLSIAIAAIYGLSLSSLSFAQDPTDPSFTATNPFLQCEFTKPGCFEKSQVVPQANGDEAPLFTCSPIDPGTNCNCNYIQGDGDGLAWFYTGWNYTGFQYQAYGTYGDCYDLPKSYDKQTNSIQLSTNPSTICCIYTDYGCNTNGHAWFNVTKNIPQFLGFFIDGVSSYRCAEWVDADSTCGFDWPQAGKK